MTSSTPKAPTELPSFAGPDLNTKKPKFRLPPGAADCHVHVLGPREKYQYSPERLYTPPDVFLQDYINVLDALECDRAVLVQSGIHGVHNEVIVDALAQYPDRLRAIALINERITDAELDKLAAVGVRGFRANLHHKIGVQFDAAKRLAARVKRLGWHVMLDSPMPNDGDLCDLLAVWVPDAQVRSQILVDNPQRLYGF